MKLENRLLSYKSSVRALLFFLFFPLSVAASADTYNVADFTVAGITSGDPGTEVHKKIAEYFSIDSDELKLVEVEETPDRQNILAPSERRKYEYGDFLVSVSLYPDYVHETDHSLVVGSVRFAPVTGGDADIALALLERVRDEYISQHGEPSSATNNSNPIVRHYYWCTTMTENRPWPCVLKEPNIHLHQLFVWLGDETYQKAYMRAPRVKK